MERQRLRPRRGLGRPAAGSREDGKVILRESMHMYGGMCTLEARAAISNARGRKY